MMGRGKSSSARRRDPYSCVASLGDRGTEVRYGDESHRTIEQEKVHALRRAHSYIFVNSEAECSDFWLHIVAYITYTHPPSANISPTTPPTSLPHSLDLIFLQAFAQALRTLSPSPS